MENRAAPQGNDRKRGVEWAINGRFLSQSVTGVQRYALEIIRAMDHALAAGHAASRSLSLTLVSPPGARPLPKLTKISTRTAGRLSGQAWEQFELPRFAGFGLLSLCNTGPVLARNHIVCIHDANTREAPGSYSLPFRTAYRVLHPALARTASQIVTVSHASASSLARFGIGSVANTQIIPNGHEHALAWMPAPTHATRSAGGPDTVVVLGSLAPHKNIGVILGLADRFAAKGIRIAVVGLSDPRVFAGATASGVAPNVVWLGRLPDDELAALLEDCLCLAFPSIAEGFGLPPLEAMARGCPVVCSRSASMPEVCGDAALYAPPDDPDAWFAAILRLRDQPELRRTLINRSKARLVRFSWARSASLYLETMLEISGLASFAADNVVELRQPAI